MTDKLQSNLRDGVLTAEFVDDAIALACDVALHFEQTDAPLGRRARKFLLKNHNRTMTALTNNTNSEEA